LDFLQVITPLLYFTSFGAVFALFTTIIVGLVWALIILFRRVVRWLRRALRE